MGFSRAKRVSDPLAEEVRARLVGCSFSSGSEHTGDGIEDYEDDDLSPCLSDLVETFLEDEVKNTLNDESDDHDDSGSDSDSDSELQLPDFAEDIAKLLRNSLKEDSYGRIVLIHVARSMEMLPFIGSDHEQRAVLRRKVMSILRDLGHNAAICKTKWKSSGALTAGNYEFIDVVSSQTVRYIVDLDFKSQFQIARPTGQYARVLQSLPAVFVGKGDDLKRILRLVSDAARISLRSRGLTLPLLEMPICQQTKLEKSSWMWMQIATSQRKWWELINKLVKSGWKSIEQEESNHYFACSFKLNAIMAISRVGGFSLYKYCPCVCKKSMKV